MGTKKIPKFVKPSQVWAWASKNIVQCKGWLTDGEGAYCALGIIGHIRGLSDDYMEKGDIQTNDRFREARKSIWGFDSLSDLNLKLIEIYGKDIAQLNDEECWSFATFEWVAKELGY